MPNPYLAAALREQADLRASMVAQTDPEGYDALTVPELRAEISRRNEDRDDDARISASGNKPDLIKALEADDHINPPEES